MSAEDRRRVSREMMDRIDRVVSGHELQRSPEAAPRYIQRVDDGPLRFDEERLTFGQDMEPRVWRVTGRLGDGPAGGHCPMCGADRSATALYCATCAANFAIFDAVIEPGVDERPIRGAELNLEVFDEQAQLTPPPHGRCPCGAHLEPYGSFLVCPECESTFRLTEDGWRGPPWTITEDGRFFGRITVDPAAPDTAAYEPFGVRPAPEPPDTVREAWRAVWEAIEAASIDTRLRLLEWYEQRRAGH